MRGILPNCFVSVISAQWFGSDALELTYKDPTGKVGNELLYRHDEQRFEIVEEGRPWSLDGTEHCFGYHDGVVGFLGPQEVVNGIALPTRIPICPELRSLSANCRTKQ